MARHLNQKWTPFLFALILHLIILFFLIANLHYFFQNQATMQATKALEPMQAIAVNQAAVEKQVARIKAQEETKRMQVLQKEQAEQSAKEARQAQVDTLEEMRFAHEAHEARVQAQTLLAKQRIAALNKLQAESDQLKQAPQEGLSTKTPIVQLPKITQSEAVKQIAKEALTTENLEENTLARQQKSNELARYKAMILNAIGKQWIIPPGVDRTLSCQLLIKLDSDGAVLNVEVFRSSGNELLDQSAVMAVLKASPLPLPQSPLLLEQFRELQLTVKPEGVLN